MITTINKMCPGCGIEFPVYWRNKNKKYCSKKCGMTGENNHRYKKDGSVTLSRLHRRIEEKLGRPEKCSACGKVGAVDLANISNEYKHELSDWEWLCRKCHMTKDGRLDAAIKRASGRRLAPKNCEFCGKEFTGSRGKTKFCSTSCGAKKQHAEGRVKTRGKSMKLLLNAIDKTVNKEGK